MTYAADFSINQQNTPNFMIETSVWFKDLVSVIYYFIIELIELPHVNAVVVKSETDAVVVYSLHAN